MTVAALPRKKIKLKARDLAQRRFGWRHPGGELHESEYGKWFNTATFNYNELSERAKGKAIEEFGQHVETWDDHDSEWLVDYFKTQAKEAGYADAEFYYSVGFCQSDYLSFKDCSFDYKALGRRLLPELTDHTEKLVADHAQDLWGMLSMEVSFGRENSKIDITGDSITETMRIGCRVTALTDGGADERTYPYLVPLLEEMIDDDDHDGAAVVDYVGFPSGRKLRYVTTTVGEFVAEYAEKLAQAIVDDTEELTGRFYREFHDSILDAGSEKAIKDRLEGDDWFEFRVDGTIPGKRDRGEWWH